jgi:hypothetical protein
MPLRLHAEKNVKPGDGKAIRTSHVDQIPHRKQPDRPRIG